MLECVILFRGPISGGSLTACQTRFLPNLLSTSLSLHPTNWLQSPGQDLEVKRRQSFLPISQRDAESPR